MLNWHYVIGGAWAIALAVWIAGSFSSKRSVREQPFQNRAKQLLLVVLGGFLFSGVVPTRFGGQRIIIPRTQITDLIAVALTIMGLGFAVWSRVVLGRNWSANVTLKEDHELMRTGPYGIVRHPIYSGLLLAICGAVLLRGTAGALFGVAIFLLLFRSKIRTEEGFMLEQFGPAYRLYQGEVKSLIPFVW